MIDKKVQKWKARGHGSNEEYKYKIELNNKNTSKIESKYENRNLELRIKQ